MVMFKARFKPLSDKPRAGVSDKPRPDRSRLQQQQQQQPQPERKAPPIEQERGPQHPIKEPGPGEPPERA
jgi:hypothetical protein